MDIQEEFATLKKIFSKNNLKRPQKKWPSDIKRAIKCLNNNIFEHGFNVKNMRERCKIPQKNFSSRFKHYVEYTPASYLKFYRIECSKLLLLRLENFFPINKLAFEVGYEYPSSFNSAFKSLTGTTPKAYRNLYKRK